MESLIYHQKYLYCTTDITRTSHKLCKRQPFFLFFFNPFNFQDVRLSTSPKNTKCILVIQVLQAGQNDNPFGKHHGYIKSGSDMHSHSKAGLDYSTSPVQQHISSSVLDIYLLVTIFQGAVSGQTILWWTWNKVRISQKEYSKMIGVHC
jgi:hypothetical protein